MVEDAAEGVGRDLSSGCALDRLGDRDPEAARRVRMLLQDLPPGLRLFGRARHDLRAPGLDQRAPVRLLLVRDPDHVDLALEPDQPARKRERAPPLPRAGLRREARPPFLLVVVGLRHSRIRLVTSGRADTLVLVEDPRAGSDRLLEPPRPKERRRPPE